LSYQHEIGSSMISIEAEDGMPRMTSDTDQQWMVSAQ
jgi:hypothetical protein